MTVDLQKFADTIEDMVLQHRYPGFEERSLKLGLPQEFVKAPPKLFNQALSHESVLVKLAALRWFIERPGIAKNFSERLVNGLNDPDEWVKQESLRALERIDGLKLEDVEAICPCLTDPHVDVRKAAAKALGKLGISSDKILAALQDATQDKDHEVRGKVVKALRKLGAYSS